MAFAPCRNPNCSKQGQSHPNCHCYSSRPVPAGMEAPGTTMMAEGGVVGCTGSHDPKCEYHLPSDTSETFHNAVTHHGLSNLIKQSSKSDLDVKNPHRAFDNYINASRRGSKKYHSVVKSTFDKEKHGLSSNPDSLQKYMDNVKTNPESAMELGSGIGNTSPSHVIDLAGAVGAAGKYLESIKPSQTATGPLNSPVPPSQQQQASYNRQVHLVEQPLSIIEHVKNGSLLPQDLQTLSTVYPKLYAKLQGSIMEHIIDVKTDNKTVPYHSRISLSQFLGQPMDTTMTQGAMLAAIQANTPKVPQEPPGKAKKPSKPSLAQQEKLNGMFETETQQLQNKEK